MSRLQNFQVRSRSFRLHCTYRQVLQSQASLVASTAGLGSESWRSPAYATFSLRRLGGVSRSPSKNLPELSHGFSPAVHRHASVPIHKLCDCGASEDQSSTLQTPAAPEDSRSFMLTAATLRHLIDRVVERCLMSGLLHAVPVRLYSVEFRQVSAQHRRDCVAAH